MLNKKRRIQEQTAFFNEWSMRTIAEARRMRGFADLIRQRNEHTATLYLRQHETFLRMADNLALNATLASVTKPIAQRM